MPKWRAWAGALLDAGYGFEHEHLETALPAARAAFTATVYAWLARAVSAHGMALHGRERAEPEIAEVAASCQRSFYEAGSPAHIYGVKKRPQYPGNGSAGAFLRFQVPDWYDQALGAGQNVEALRPSWSKAQPANQPTSEQARPTKKGGISAACIPRIGVGEMALLASRYQSRHEVKPKPQLMHAARELRLPKRTSAT